MNRLQRKIVRRRNRQFLLREVFKTSETLQDNYYAIKDYYYFVEKQERRYLDNPHSPRILSKAIDNYFEENIANKYLWFAITFTHKRKFSGHHRQQIDFYSDKSEDIKSIMYKNILLELMVYCIERKFF